MTIDKILKFAQSKGYENVKFLCRWNGWDCYEPIMNDGAIRFVGYPLVIMVKGDMIRISKGEESLKINSIHL